MHIDGPQTPAVATSRIAIPSPDQTGGRVMATNNLSDEGALDPLAVSCGDFSAQGRSAVVDAEAIAD